MEFNLISLLNIQNIASGTVSVLVPNPLLGSRFYIGINIVYYTANVGYFDTEIVTDLKTSGYTGVNIINMHRAQRFFNAYGNMSNLYKYAINEAVEIRFNKAPAANFDVYISLVYGENTPVKIQSVDF